MKFITRLLCAVIGLKDALRLKSFDSTELDVRPTKIPKGDPPYLSVVQENLYPIREPTVPVNQGGSAGLGGSGLAPSAHAMNLSSVQVATVAGGDKGKKMGSSGTKGSGVNAEEEGDDDDSGVRPQISLKRGRAISSKPDLNPKQLKKKKLDFKTIALDDDELDQVTGFSTAGGLLDNLNAHLPGVTSNVSRPSPQLIDGGDSASSSPLWYETEVVFLCRELGSGEGVGMDTAKALEKYILDWSLVNKDRIVDALSAKMALFHLGTPAEHAYHRKMSGPELGNALMLNQAQSNSLVVETYKHWVEEESNCRRFEREVAFLKSEDSIRSKTKQEISSLRSQVSRLKEQVSEVKEVNKSSQASAAAAHEARDKAVSEL
ncbi:hypothetical protein Hanom_Chr16g01476951 [Helianthus anomalus]